VSKETYSSVKRDLQQCQKRPTAVSKETTHLHDADAVRHHLPVDFHHWQHPGGVLLHEPVFFPPILKRQCPHFFTEHILLLIYIHSYTNFTPIFRRQCPSRQPTLVSKETYTSVKRDLQHFTPIFKRQCPSRPTAYKGTIGYIHRGLVKFS